ncbi:MAG: hypothetical protein AB1589_21880 [Cyanobacteriota bacterium]
MSQEEHKQPNSEPLSPQAPPTPAAADRSRINSETTLDPVRRMEKPKQPFVKAQSIKLLRGTVNLLEGVIEKLETEPVREPATPVAPPITKLESSPVLDVTPATIEPEIVSSPSELPVSDTLPVMPEPTVSGTLPATPEDVISDTPPVMPEPPVSDTPAATPESSVSDTSAVMPELPVSDTSPVMPEPPVSDTSPIMPEPPVSDTSPVMPEPPASDPSTLGTQPVAQKPTKKPVAEPTKPRLIDRLLPTFDKVQAFWDATLARVRFFLPPAWNQKLSDWALTGAIAGIVVVVLITTAALLPETPAQEVKAPPNTIEAPPELKAPRAPQPIAVEPPPELELTPEQSIVAAVQHQVADITERYGNGLIQSVEANFLSSRLIVRVSDGWYTLKESQQNKLADEILRRSRELDFSKLEITDLKEMLLARSPVVGSNMVILKRQELATTL